MRNRALFRTALLLLMLFLTLACSLLSPTPPAPTALPQPPVTIPPATAPPTSHPTLEPTAGPTPTDTSMPPLYDVAFVNKDDVLNVHSGPGVENTIIGELPYDIEDQMLFFTRLDYASDGSVWANIHTNQLNGWVNRVFLTERVLPSIFCRDSRAEAIVDGLKEAIETSDPVALVSLVNRQRGLLIRHNWWNPEVRLATSQVTGFFADSTSYDWGLGHGSGLPITGSTAEVILPLLREDLLDADAQIACNEILAGGSAGSIVLPSEYEALNFYSVHRPPPDEDNAFDWGTWVIGIEYWDSQPYLCFLVHYEWEI